MTAHERKLMVEVPQPFTAEPGTRFISQGDEGDAMYILAVGECKASITTGQYEREVKRYQPGDYFGELALMDNAPGGQRRRRDRHHMPSHFRPRISSCAGWNSRVHQYGAQRSQVLEIMAQLAGSAQPQPTAPPPGPVLRQQSVSCRHRCRHDLQCQLRHQRTRRLHQYLCPLHLRACSLPAAMPPATMPPAPAPAAYQPPLCRALRRNLQLLCLR